MIRSRIPPLATQNVQHLFSALTTTQLLSHPQVRLFRQSPASIQEECVLDLVKYNVLHKLAPSARVPCACVHCLLRHRKFTSSSYTGPNLKKTNIPSPSHCYNSLHVTLPSLSQGTMIRCVPSLKDFL